jgi:hypothetical protein
MNLHKLTLAALTLVAGLAGVARADIDYLEIANDANEVIIRANNAKAILQTINPNTYPERTALINRATDIAKRADLIRKAALQNYPNTPVFLNYVMDTLQRAEVCEEHSNKLRQKAHQLNDNVTRNKASDVREHFDEAGDKLRSIKNELD